MTVSLNRVASITDGLHRHKCIGGRIQRLCICEKCAKPHFYVRVLPVQTRPPRKESNFLSPPLPPPATLETIPFVQMSASDGARSHLSGRGGGRKEGRSFSISRSPFSQFKPSKRTGFFFCEGGRGAGSRICEKVG